MNGNTAIAENFIIKEFVSLKFLNFCKLKGFHPSWFISKKMVGLAQFYKVFFTAYYKKKYPNLKTVSIQINTGGWQTRGYRDPMDRSKNGAKHGQHNFFNAFDCEIILVFNDGRRVEADYIEIHAIIYANESLFLEAGLTTIESVKMTTGKGWLHSDGRWWLGQENKIHTILGPKYDKL